MTTEFEQEVAHWDMVQLVHGSYGDHSAGWHAILHMVREAKGNPVALLFLEQQLGLTIVAADVKQRMIHERGDGG